jgi:hypothetical protein
VSEWHDALPAAFWDLVVKDAKTGCWNWGGKTYPNTYGRWDQDGKSYLTHRMTKANELGRPLTADEVVDHICMNKRCCNPGHTEVVDIAENTRRWAEQNITHCPKDHPYDTENTLLNRGPDGQLWRRCRRCHADRERERARRKAAGLPALKPKKGFGPGKQPNQGRPLSTKMKLGWLIAHDPEQRPMYMWAAELGIAYSTLQKYVLGLRQINHDHLLIICDAFGVEPEDVIGPTLPGTPVPYEQGKAC